MNDTFKRGDKVHFGRTHGEKTLGEIIKVNPKRYKVKQLESRGTMRDFPIGTVWSVAPSLMSLADPATAAPAPTGKRPDGAIIAEIKGIYGQLHDRFRELGREVSETEAFGG